MESDFHILRELGELGQFPPRRGQHTDSKHHSAVQNDSLKASGKADQCSEIPGFPKHMGYWEEQLNKKK